MANLGTLNVTVPWASSSIPTKAKASSATVPFTPVAVGPITKRPIAWWRGGGLVPSGDISLGGAEAGMYTVLQYPDNGNFRGLTETNAIHDALVKVAVIYVPTMKIIGYGVSDASGNLQIGVAGTTQGNNGVNPLAVLALDQTDLKNYAMVAFDPSRNLNLVGFDMLTPGV